MKSKLLMKMLLVCLGLSGAGNVAALTTNYNGTLDFTGTTVPVILETPFGTVNGNAGIDLHRYYLGNSLNGSSVSFTTHNAFNSQGTILALIFTTDPNDAIFSNPASLASLISPTTDPATFLNANVVGWQYLVYGTSIPSNGTSDISSLFTPPMSFTNGTNYYAFVGGGSAINPNSNTLADSSVGYTLSLNDGVPVNNGAPVPVPAAAWLLGSGLAGMFGMVRRRRTRGES